ncbi:MAG: hypothetical protein AAF423_04335 [Pseudomonadota bacterium]
MNVFATARFYLHLGLLLGISVLLICILVAPTLIPNGLFLYTLSIAIALIGAAVFWALAYFRPVEADAANDELVQFSEQKSVILGYWATLAVFMVMAGLTLTDNLDARIAFYFLGFPLGIIPSIYMVIAFMRGRAG